MTKKGYRDELILRGFGQGPTVHQPRQTPPHGITEEERTLLYKAGRSWARADIRNRRVQEQQALKKEVALPLTGESARFVKIVEVVASVKD